MLYTVIKVDLDVLIGKVVNLFLVLLQLCRLILELLLLFGQLHALGCAGMVDGITKLGKLGAVTLLLFMYIVGAQTGEKIARKYGVDYAVKKDRSSSPPKYLIFFKGRDADALTAAFTEYTSKKVKKAEKTERPSVLAKLSQFKEMVKNAVVDRTKRKELER